MFRVKAKRVFRVIRVINVTKAVRFTRGIYRGPGFLVKKDSMR